MVEQQIELKGYLGARIDALEWEIKELREQLLEDENWLLSTHKEIELHKQIRECNYDYERKLHREIEERFAFLMWVVMFYGCLIIWSITK